MALPLRVRRMQVALRGMVAGCLLVMLFCMFPALDLTLSALFYAEQQTPSWYLKDAIPGAGSMCMASCRHA